MKKLRSFIASTLLIGLFAPAWAEYHPPIEYGVAATIDFVLYNTDGTLDVDEVDGGAEVTVDCDGTPATATNDFADEGAFYSIALTAAETQCARVTLTIAATDTNVVTIPTFGNASAQVNYDGAGYTEAGGTGDHLTAIDLPNQTMDITGNLSGSVGSVGTGGITATSIAADAIGSSELAATAVAEIQTGLATSAALAIVDGNVDDIETDTADMQPKLGTYSDLGSGATLSGNLEDMRDNGTAVYSRTTDSLQALRDRGDAAWTTGGGGSSLAVADDTAQGGTASTIQLAAGETFGDDILNGNSICIDGGTGDGQCRVISDYTGSTDTATIEPNWITNPSSDSTYFVYDGSVNVSTWSLDAASVEQGLEDSDDIWSAGTRTLTASTNFNDLSAAQVAAQVAAELTTYDALVPADLPTNFGSMTISAGGAVDSLVQGFLNNTIAESSADRIAGNFEVFWDNANALTTNTVDDVGSGAGGSFWSTGEQNEIRGRLGITGTTAAGGNTPTLATAADLATAQTDLNTLTGTDGVTLATSQPNYAPATAAALATVDTEVGVIDGIVDNILEDTGTTIPATLGTPADTDLATDIVNLAALLGISEPGSVPNFSGDAGDALSWLLALSRNEIQQTATTKTIRNDADSANIATCAVSDNGTTFQRSECQ